MRTFGTFMAALVVAIGEGPRSAAPDEQTRLVRAAAPAIDFPLLDLRGATHALHQNDERRVRAFVFLSTECPIANGYLPTLNQLRARFAEKAVDWYGVVADPTVTRSQAAKHFAEFQVGFPVLVDSSGLLLRRLQPTHVPEAFVIGRDGQLIYRGAIDNAWEAIGRRRPRAEKTPDLIHVIFDNLRHDLEQPRKATPQ